ncbi:MAG TPA: hypothetical protein VJ779_02350 [Acetobacteraceae bacterium]|nr:hypothetical protein [Acetobacteraceae bacterium]
MAYQKTIIRRDPWQVEPFLKQMNMTVPGLCRVRDVALTERANATDFHPVNAPGTFAYHHGVWALRNEFVGKYWKLECPGGVEAIISSDLTIRVAYANVDLCCDEAHHPLPCSGKGAGVERLCQGNLFGDALPTYTRQHAADGIPLYYVMVDPDGRIELSRPTIEGKSFGPCVERNFISYGHDDDGGKRIIHPVTDSPVDLTPTITRKTA